MDSACTPVIGDLLEINQHLVIQCCWHECQREERLTAVQAVELLGFSTTIAQATRRLRCSRCGHRGREKWITVRPCSLDREAWDARERRRSARERGEEARPGLEDHLETLRRLVGGGELGGDGPVQWPVDGRLKGL